MIKIRNLHLWIGLITSLLILIEAVTGLIMIEPWLIGVNQPPPEQRVQLEREAMGHTIERGALSEGDFGDSNPAIMRTIKGLHEGKIGNTDLSIIIDIIAISLITLTITGIILSIKSLRAQRKR